MWVSMAGMRLCNLVFVVCGGDDDDLGRSVEFLGVVSTIGVLVSIQRSSIVVEVILESCVSGPSGAGCAACVVPRKDERTKESLNENQRAHDKPKARDSEGSE
jgi:hypothetical protein